MESREPEILLLHDGELEDVGALLREMGLVCHEQRQTAAAPELDNEWDLAIGIPPLLLEFERSGGKPAPIAIAVQEGESRTLRAALKRADVDFVVRRPFHPEALRLLLRHSLYSGPEKRRRPRVSVGGEVRFRLGWRRHGAILAELSTSGCRLLTDCALREGDSLQLQIPAEVGAGRSVSVRAQVVRCEAPQSGASQAFGLAFAALPVRAFKRLGEIVAQYQHGPAARTDTPGAAEDRSERRLSPRRELDRHIPSLSEASAPVLMGRDISIGGMRVDAHPSLSVGTDLRIALHVRARQEPLVVKARVAREDGQGFALEFVDLSEAERDYLEKMVKFLPILARGHDESEAGVVFSEILEASPA